MSDFTVYEKMMAAEREVKLRQIFRRRAVELADLRRQGATVDRYGNRLDPRKDPDFNKLEYQIRCMQEIANEYRAKWDGVVPELNVEAGFMV